VEKSVSSTVETRFGIEDGEGRPKFWKPRASLTGKLAPQPGGGFSFSRKGPEKQRKLENQLTTRRANP